MKSTIAINKRKAVFSHYCFCALGTLNELYLIAPVQLSDIHILLKKKKKLFSKLLTTYIIIYLQKNVFICKTYKNYTLFQKIHLFPGTKNKFTKLLCVHIGCHVLLRKQFSSLNNPSSYTRNVYPTHLCQNWTLKF